MSESGSAAVPTDELPAERQEPKLSVTAGFRQWLFDQQVSLAFTSYQTGRLILVGLGPDGRLSLNRQNYKRAMGLHYSDGVLHLAGATQIWRMENLLDPGQYVNGAFDCMLIPRVGHVTGYVDTHDLSVDRSGRVIFVNTRFSCLATLDDRHAFQPVWKPPFISALQPEDRCHLNGLAMENGVPRVVTAANTTDTENGWRELPKEGGVAVDVASNAIIVSGLSMPHSPRLHKGALWLQDSGRGFLLRIDMKTGQQEKVVFCPGFLRGMAMHGDYAIAALSQARHGNFKDLSLQLELDSRGEEPWCGLVIIDLNKGEIVEFLRIEAGFTELFDVAVLPGVRNPMSVGLETQEFQSAIRFNSEFAPVEP
jgi:uncharacterized protein (TIGR03032 family)